MSAGILHIIATPIGNLEDCTYRAVSLLGDVDLIVCEDTRHTRKLLERYGIRQPLESYHDFNETEKAEELIGRLASGANIALVSDAGTPTVSDPGYRLVRLCRQRGIRVTPVPGPSAAVAALSVSGLGTDEFCFAGFLPSRKEARRRKIKSLEQLPCTLVFYEAPNRLRATMRDMQEILGDREVFLGRELTKMHEECLFGRISEVLARVTARGEAVIVLQGADRRVAKTDTVDLKETSRQELLKIAARRLGVGRKQLYEALFRK